MNIETQKFYGHGKLLLTGEYAVLDGAKALALPTKFGQSLEVSISDSKERHIIWESFSETGERWLYYNSNEKQDSEENKMLEKILSIVEELNPNAFSNNKYHFKTTLEFNRKWGLGSSSTLLYCLAEWANIDMSLLLEKTFGGSGYDLASAKEDNAIIYSKTNNKATWENIELKFPFNENLYFVYLGIKKNSRDAISHYRETKSDTVFIDKVSELTNKICKAQTLKEFQAILTEHENLLSKRLKTPTLKESLFFDNDKIIAKSLGGWGGDFILIATELNLFDLKKYLATKNLLTVLKYDEMVFSK